jgi:hypothetical protein
MPSASLWSKHTILHLCPTFILSLFPASQLHAWLFFLFSLHTIFSTHIRSFHLNPSSKHPGYYRCCADGAVLLQIVGPLWQCVCAWRGSCNSTSGYCFTATLSVYKTVVTCFLRLCLGCKLIVQTLLQGTVKKCAIILQFCIKIFVYSRMLSYIVKQ